MAGLAKVRRNGRSFTYAPQPETMSALLGFLTDNCRGGTACAPAAAGDLARKHTKMRG